MKHSDRVSTAAVLDVNKGEGAFKRDVQRFLKRYEDVLDRFPAMVPLIAEELEVGGLNIRAQYFTSAVGGWLRANQFLQVSRLLSHIEMPSAQDLAILGLDKKEFKEKLTAAQNEAAKLLKKHDRFLSEESERMADGSGIAFD